MPKFAKDLAAADPDTYALVDMHRTRNWADVDEELNRVANLVLAADLGPNRRLAIFAEKRFRDRARPPGRPTRWRVERFPSTSI